MYILVNKSDTKRVQVSFTKEQWELISKFKGELGSGDADVVRNIIISWLSEKSVISSSIKDKIENEAKLLLKNNEGGS